MVKLNNHFRLNPKLQKAPKSEMVKVH